MELQRPGVNAFTCLAAGLLMLGIVAIRATFFAPSAPRSYSHSYAGGAAPTFAPPPRPVDVSALMIALDWRARPFVQRRLDELARTGDPTTPGGRQRLLHETVTLLRSAELAWMYVGVLSTQPSPADVAEQLLRSTASGLRARLRAELVRHVEAGLVVGADPPTHARALQGDGLVVVTVLVAAHVELPDVSVATDRAQLQRLVTRIGALAPSDLAALEVIWSPAAEGDRLSSAELEALYGELRRVPGAQTVGRVFCGFCAGPFSRELSRCPHCGAPSSEREPPGVARSGRR